MNEDNPKRVSIRQYAREVAVNESTIRRMVTGYVNWSAVARDRRGSLGEEIERATMSTERAAATEAVAKVHGMTFQTARRNEKRPPETGGPFSYALRA